MGADEVGGELLGEPRRRNKGATGAEEGGSEAKKEERGKGKGRRGWRGPALGRQEQISIEQDRNGILEAVSHLRQGKQDNARVRGSLGGCRRGREQETRRGRRVVDEALEALVG